MPIRDRSLSKAGGGGEAVRRISTSSTHRSTASSDAISAPISTNDATCPLATPLAGGGLIDDDIRTPVPVASPMVPTAGDGEELLSGVRRTHRGSQKAVSGRRSTERMCRRVSTAIDSESLPMIITTTLVPIDRRSSNQRPQAMTRVTSRKHTIDGDRKQHHESNTRPYHANDRQDALPDTYLSATLITRA